MQYNVNGKVYNFDKNIRDNRALRLSFDKLSQETFGLSFENWYQNGFWTKSYIPHVLIDGERVVANVSVNFMDIVWKSERKRYIQLGTVMTDTAYRYQGLSRLLIEKVLEDWKEKCDAIYLFANDSVLDYYPQFGFVKMNEYQYQLNITPKPGVVRKLDMTRTYDRELLLEKYKKLNPFSALQMVDNIGLLMFYCSEILKDDIYYLKDCDAVVIAKQTGETLICFDIFCHEKNDIQEIISTVSSPDTTDVILGFTPKAEITGQKSLLQEQDTTLFVLADKKSIFTNNQLMFPLLSHA